MMNYSMYCSIKYLILVRVLMYGLLQIFKDILWKDICQNTNVL